MAVSDGPTRRHLLKRLGAAGVGLTLAGCVDEENGKGGTPTGTASEMPTDSPTETPAGTQTETPAADVGILDGPIDASMLTFTQGAAGVLGVQAQRGAELAVTHVNETGGVAGQQPITLTVRDESSDAIQKYRRAIDDGADVTFGPISSGNHEALTLEIEDLEVVNVGTDGGVPRLYEETNPNPTYSFRFQNYQVMECVTMAREAVARLGADDIDTVAGINPDYAFGHDEMAMFTTAIRELTGADVVHEAYPALGQSEMTTEVGRLVDAAADVTFSSLWGPDVLTFLDEAEIQGLYDVTDVFGTVLYSAAGDVPASKIPAEGLYAGARNYYWDHPSIIDTAAGQALFDDAIAMDDIVVPTQHFMSGYGAVMGWAAGVEAALDQAGQATQETVASAMEGLTFSTPAGEHRFGSDHQCRSRGFAGRMDYDSSLGAAVLADTNAYAPDRIGPSPGQDHEDWLQQLN